jgi:hypothetical protein
LRTCASFGLFKPTTMVVASQGCHLFREAVDVCSLLITFCFQLKNNNCGSKKMLFPIPFEDPVWPSDMYLVRFSLFLLIPCPKNVLRGLPFQTPRNKTSQYIISRNISTYILLTLILQLPRTPLSPSSSFFASVSGSFGTYGRLTVNFNTRPPYFPCPL